MPVSEDDVRCELAKVPSAFLDGLRAVLLLGGSKRQEKISRKLFYYGRYESSAIFLHPYPITRLAFEPPVALKPNVAEEYARAGAEVTQSNGKFRVSFEIPALRKFYLANVLMHELGHHVDRENDRRKSPDRSEGFAHWFATEYGFRLRRR
jgi:hypothetical protein